ncbi:3-phosphoglycerate dehydrogenase [Bordetella genomosp. 10]|uniref:3-phosphoglycerate dehydrogenase n=1 Tax=Bordetella genomosp. 10 TaxID=1416804 RepID=A0A261S9N4_9BORD|nr:hydroxyacid dehydrogenase [Bordetella genomosp. 10]OZI34098.1 3-phosphoglycerate dehydrogenase [Bordetella genomosp. 10]
MAASKLVVRFDLWIDPAFDAGLARDPEISLRVAAVRGAREDAWALLREARVYHVSPARNELPAHWLADEPLLRQCPGLLCVSSGGAGHDTVDVQACTRAGVVVVNQAGGNAAAVAEHALGLMIAVSRRIAESDRKLRGLRGFSRESVMGHEIGGKVLGLVGIGHAGTRTAALARAFGMQVLAFDPLLSTAQVEARGARAVDFSTLLRVSDIVSLHCPRDAATQGMFDAAAFAAMKPGALFISTARGGIHDEGALHAALAGGHLAGAGLDVWEPEPPPLDHPLLALDNVVATFHTAGVTHEGRRNVAAMGAEQIVDLLNGGRPARLVNPEVWPLYARRYRDTYGRAPD